MAVQKLARTDVVTVEPDTPIHEVTEAMSGHSVGSVIVVEDEEPVGIVTDRDLAVTLLTDDSDVGLFSPDVDGTQLVAADVMTADPLVATADDRLPRVLHHMNEARARRIPIVDDEGSLVGILALDDVIVHLAGESTHVSAQLDNVAGVIRAESPEE